MSTTSQTPRHITLLASLGSTLEYYDFVVYGLMSTYLGAVFFPPQNQNAAYLQAFLIFAVGYFSRPFGGTVIGIIGDRYGRRPAFLASTILMAFSTLVIACLPGYESFGILTVIVLVLCRVAQGLSFGGELPGAMTIVAEFSPMHHRGRKASLVIASTSLGALLASGVLSILSTYLSKDEIIAWGWRLPFLGGGILGVLLLIARNTIQETPVFQAVQGKTETRKPLVQLMRHHGLALVKGAGLTAFMAAMILTNIYFPFYIPKFFAYTANDVYWGTTISLVFSVVILPLMGLVADFFPQKAKTLQWTCLGYALLSVPIFSLLASGSLWALVGFLMIQQWVIALFGASFFPTLVRLFPPDVRYTGIALAYNLTWAAIATLPMAYTALLNVYDTPWVVPAVLSAIAGLSFMAAGGIEMTSSTGEEREAGDGVQDPLPGQGN